MKTSKWQDQSGQDRYSTEIVLENMQMLDGRTQDQPAQHHAPQQSAQQPDFDDEIKF